MRHPSLTANNILKSLSSADAALIVPHLQAVVLPVRTSLEQRSERIENVYFIETGIASVVSDIPSEVELAIIGSEGMTGISLVLAGDHNAHFESYMQIAGTAQRIAAANLRDCIDQSVPLHRALLRYSHMFLIQSAGELIRKRAGLNGAAPGPVASHGQRPLGG